MSKIRIAVTGLGNMGESLVYHWLPHYAEQAEVVAVCDADRDKRSRAVAATGASEYEAAQYIQMLDEMKPDLVYIAVPPAFHYEAAVAAFERGLAVFCEKPLANSLEEARTLLKCAEESGKLHAVHFSFPQEPAVLQLGQWVNEGKVGDIRELELLLQFPQWPRAWQQNSWIATRHQGGFILEVGVHWIHMIQQVFGEITHVQSHVTYPDDPQQCERKVQATLTLDSGLRVHLSGHSGVVEQERVSLLVHGKQGDMALENWEQLYWNEVGQAPQRVEPAILPEQSHLPVFGEIVKLLQGHSGQIYDFYDGYNAQVVLEALRQPSAESDVDVRPLYIRRKQ
ncbi:Gfo/Idh/MocA family protein [Paenibacillus wenxiniae]|uniref:Gfo/Idh/MocA family protein n=1 Tax=Paenibacillus wenxiniae TaxID=1636843 RepID=A0ABW4REX1_9BACL